MLIALIVTLVLLLGAVIFLIRLDRRSREAIALSRENERKLHVYMQALDLVTRPEEPDDGGGGHRHLRALPLVAPSSASAAWFARSIKQHPGRAAAVTSLAAATGALIALWPDGHQPSPPIAMPPPSPPAVQPTTTASAPAAPTNSPAATTPATPATTTGGATVELQGVSLAALATTQHRQQPTMTRPPTAPPRTTTPPPTSSTHPSTTDPGATSPPARRCTLMLNLDPIVTLCIGG